MDNPRWNESDYAEYQRQRRGTSSGKKPARGVQQEARLQAECEEYLQKIGAWYLHLREARGNRPGVPDLIGVYQGRAFGIELKSRTGKLSAEQVRELAWIKQAGGITGEVRTLEEFVAILHRNDGSDGIYQKK